MAANRPFLSVTAAPAFGRSAPPARRAAVPLCLLARRALQAPLSLLAPLSLRGRLSRLLRRALPVKWAPMARPAAGALAALVLGAGVAVADPVLGLWQTEPDGKDQVGHVQFRECGPGVCGKIVAAYGADGNAVTTRNVGRELIWDMVPQGGGAYAGGQVLVPLLGADFPAEMQLSGDRLSLRACNAMGVCRSQTWRRVR